MRNISTFFVKRHKKETQKEKIHYNKFTTKMHKGFFNYVSTKSYYIFHCNLLDYFWKSRTILVLYS